jgi:hypothetical protein
MYISFHWAHTGPQLHQCSWCLPDLPGCGSLTGSTRVSGYAALYTVHRVSNFGVLRPLRCQQTPEELSPTTRFQTQRALHSAFPSLALSMQAGASFL